MDWCTELHFFSRTIGYTCCVLCLIWIRTHALAGNKVTFWLQFVSPLLLDWPLTLPNSHHSPAVSSSFHFYVFYLFGIRMILHSRCSNYVIKKNKVQELSTILLYPPYINAMHNCKYRLNIRRIRRYVINLGGSAIIILIKLITNNFYNFSYCYIEIIFIQK